MIPFRKLTAKVAVLAQANIDTDQIIPARFLKITHRLGLGRHLFSGWRFDEQGQPRPDFILNQPEVQDARILVAGNNFGCGSSREHAPWALLDYGFRAVISSEIADIFCNNALKNGLLPIVVPPAFLQRLMATPAGEITIDLENNVVWATDGSTQTFHIEPFARYCLLKGHDQLDFLLSQQDAIHAYEEQYV